jgi:L-ascorbate metabolism protein UlaG (beta-lactamase superfamily)
MNGLLEETVFSTPLSEQLAEPAGSGLSLFWLGQAGFILDIAGVRVIIDPYLSDSLADKYKETARPHVRMMPPPIRPDEVAPIDLVLVTHAHTDHMDPGTLKPLLAANPAARLVAPRAAAVQAVERSGLPADRILLVDAGDRMDLAQGLMLQVSRAAHETLERNDQGRHRFLGYALSGGGVTVWHSGDGVPFPGLVAEVQALHPDIALLPVNGRRPELSQNGVPGNFTLEEAIDLCRQAGVPQMIAHHYGLFDFNTERPEVIDAAAAATRDVHVLRARTGIRAVWKAAERVFLSR